MGDSWALRGGSGGDSGTRARTPCGTPWGGMAVVVCFLWVSVAMYEFIATFDSLYALNHVGFFADSTFIGGSVRHVQHPVMALLATALAIVAVPHPARPTHVGGHSIGLSAALGAAPALGRGATGG